MRVAIFVMNFFQDGRRNTRRGGFSPGSGFWFWSGGCVCGCCCWLWLRPNGFFGSVSVRRSLVSPGMLVRGKGGALFGGRGASAGASLNSSAGCTFSRRSGSRCIRMPRTAGRGAGGGGGATRRGGRTLRPPTPAGRDVRYSVHARCYFAPFRSFS